MKIYFAHPQTIDYKAIYDLLKSEPYFADHEVILPHDGKKHENHTRYFYGDIDVVIAEVSEPSTGLGIELGWASDYAVPIYCFYKKGSKPSGSLSAVTDTILEYEEYSDLRDRIMEIVEGLKSSWEEQ